MSIGSRLTSKLQGFREVMFFDNRWQLVLSRAVFGESLNVLRKGDIVFIEDHDAGDANGARHVLTSAMYKRVLNRFSLPSRLAVLDLGASNGGFPLLLKSMGFELTRVLAAEMHPITFRRMTFNVEANFGCETSLHNVAVGGRSGEIEIEVGPGSTGDSILKRRGGGTVFTLPMATIDDLLGARAVDLVKMDVEGAEFDIFASDNCRALTRCRYLVAEIHGQYGDPEIVFRALRRLGFESLDRLRSDDAVYGFINVGLPDGATPASADNP